METDFIIRAARFNDCKILADIIRNSFRDVARRFSLTVDNCPKHPSNCTSAWIETDLSRGVQYFILSMNDNPIGCVGIESPSPAICYLERLSVLPEMRGKHFGLALVQHALECVASKGAGKVSIGIIAEQKELKEWYQKIGFIEVQTKIFPHLPFKVCLMELDIKGPLNHALPSDGNSSASHCRR